MKPAHGARIVLRLTSSGPPVEYALELHAPARTHHGTARVSVDGKVDFAMLSDGDAPAWLLRDAHALLRALFRARSVAGWPRRLTRWRAEPRAGA